ncbi:hypothetical protein B0H11DRAFT_2261297 [Mycena galericulata]|nr:hypothetical protein B0H11DRAFT_2261297 [Mycena galericulata]
MPEASPALRTAPSMTASSLHTSSSDTSSTFLPSVSSRAGKGHRKQRSSTSSTRAYKRSPLANDVRAIEQGAASSFFIYSRYELSVNERSVPTRAELTRVIGADMGAPLGTEIHGIPCAGVRITHGVMKGLMAWRFIVRRDPSSPRSFKSSRTTNPAVIVNFILDTGREESYVPPAALVALGYFGDTKPGAEVSLLVQGVKTKCTVAHPDEAGRVGLSFMTAGSLTYYFDAGLVAPVLYDGSGERPANVPRTIRAEDLPAAGGSWSVLARILALLRLGRH